MSDVVFWLGIGLVAIGLVWRGRLRLSGETPRRRPFLSSPSAPIFIGLIIAIWSLFASDAL